MNVLALLSLAAATAAGCGEATWRDDDAVASRHSGLKDGFLLGISPTTDNSNISGVAWEARCIRLTEGYGRFGPGLGAFARLCVNVDLGWQWSDSGPIAGLRCLKLDEPEDDFAHHWDDNYLCHKDSDLARQLVFRWSHAGRLPNMTCHPVVCSHCTPEHVWRDNYLCHAADPTEVVHRDQGGPAGALGQAKGQLQTATDGLGAYRDYDKGAVYWHPAVGAYHLGTAILNKWRSLGAELGQLGYPVAGEVTRNGGKVRFVHFQRGTIYDVDKLGTFVFSGPVHEKWLELDWLHGENAYPVTGIVTVPGGAQLATFSNEAAVLYKPGVGYRTVKGDVWRAWSEAGGLKGPGFPTAWQGTKAGYAHQKFEQGVVQCSAKGCFAVYGPIYTKWNNEKGVDGKHGFPLTSVIELQAPEKQVSAVVYFEGGPLFYTTAGGVQTAGTSKIVTPGAEVALPLSGLKHLQQSHYGTVSLGWCKSNLGYQYVKKDASGATDFFTTIRDDLLLEIGEGNAVFNVRAGCKVEGGVKVTSRTIDGPGLYTPIARVSGSIENEKPAFVRGTVNLVNLSGATRALSFALQIKDSKARWIDAVTKQLSAPAGKHYVDLEGWVPHDCLVRFEARVKNLNQPWDMRLDAVRLFGAQCYPAFDGTGVTCYQGG
jgi:hypothetical protein